MPAPRGPALLVCGLVLALTSCSDDGEPRADASPPPTPTEKCADGTPGGTECVVDDILQASAAPIDKSGAPASSASIPAVKLPSASGDLVTGGNDRQPSLTTRTFVVTVPRGSRLSVSAACQGFAELVVETVPDSKAELGLPCGRTRPNELTVQDPTPLSAPQRYSVTVTAAAPSRWYAAVGADASPPPP